MEWLIELPWREIGGIFVLLAGVWAIWYNGGNRAANEFRDRRRY